MSIKEVLNSALPVAQKDENGNWTWDSKVAFVQRMLIHGNIRKASEELSIPINTINSWKTSEWFPQLVSEVKLQQKLETSNKLNQVVERAVDIVMDRMVNGDYVLNNKTGVVIRKPVQLRDASRVATDILGKKLVIDKTQSDDNTQTDSVSDTLKKLASEFAKFNKNLNKQSAQTIEFVEVIDAKQSEMVEQSGEH